jgi:hypothetical protein
MGDRLRGVHTVRNAEVTPSVAGGRRFKFFPRDQIKPHRTRFFKSDKSTVRCQCHSTGASGPAR